MVHQDQVELRLEGVLEAPQAEVPEEQLELEALQAQAGLPALELLSGVRLGQSREQFLPLVRR